MKTLPLLIVLLLVAPGTLAQSVSPTLQQEHIEENVPAQDVFVSYLERDLLAYFKANVSANAISVKATLLRQEATQSGVAYPKFYVWVQALGPKGLIAEGAARVAAIDRQEFDVTHFISSADILASPDTLTSVFPATLASPIMARAAGR